MRYKRGSVVEVFCKDDVPSGSWRCGQVICGNGRCYTIRCIIGARDESILERVPRKSIRPLPPVVQVSLTWMPGDVVEVLHNCSWKMATVSKILRGNQLWVRLVGSLNEFKVQNYFDIRLRQSWMDGKWVVAGKGFGNYDEEKCSEQPCFFYNCKSGPFKGLKAKLDSHEEQGCVGTVNNINLQESRLLSKQNRNRDSHNVYHQAKAPESTQKYRAIEKDGRHHRVIVTDPSLLPEMVEHYSYPKKLPGEKDICFFLKNKATIFSQKDEWMRTIGIGEHTISRSLDCNDADDDVSSVGSCSMDWDNPIKWPSRILACHVGHAEDHSSDAESVCPPYKEEENYLQPNQEELAVEIHRLELHAYRCTLEALYASGPLSWEQETLMTDLRISLHISNDEHLMELRNLISSATSISVN